MWRLESFDSTNSCVTAAWRPPIIMHNITHNIKVGSDWYRIYRTHAVVQHESCYIYIFIFFMVYALEMVTHFFSLFSNECIIYPIQAVISIPIWFCVWFCKTLFMPIIAVDSCGGKCNALCNVFEFNFYILHYNKPPTA